YNYAACLTALNRFDEAVAEFRLLAAVRNQVLGPLHRDSLFSTWRLAESLHGAGNTTEALEVLEHVYKLLNESTDPPNWYRCEGIWDIANCYAELGCIDRAAALFAIDDKLLRTAPVEEINNPTIYAQWLNRLAETLVTNGNEKIRNVSRG